MLLGAETAYGVALMWAVVIAPAYVMFDALFLATTGQHHWPVIVGTPEIAALVGLCALSALPWTFPMWAGIAESVGGSAARQGFYVAQLASLVALSGRLDGLLTVTKTETTRRGGETAEGNRAAERTQAEEQKPVGIVDDGVTVVPVPDVIFL